MTVQPPDEKHDKAWLKITDNKGNLLSDKYSYPLDKDDPLIEISVPKSHPLYKMAMQPSLNSQKAHC